MLDHIIFIDIETVPTHQYYNEMPLGLQQLWDKKYEQLNMAHETPAEAYQDRAGIYAEFGKIIVIGLGYFKNIDGNLAFRMTALQNNNEKELLAQFSQLLIDKFPPYKYRFCAHNGKEFDYPYLCRRMIINQIEIPLHLDIRGKKPWEIKHIDTLELWKFGDYKHYTSLDLLCNVLDVPTSKTTMNGSKVAGKYYLENALNEISQYCLDDVLATARIYQRLTNQPLIKDDEISILTLA
jgi:predicted PolB exonuclease-like 3'-5' exonuclease